MAAKKGRSVEITIHTNIDAAVSDQQIAEKIEQALKGLPSQGKAGLKVRSVTRAAVRADTAGGYESRLWEKVTC